MKEIILQGGFIKAGERPRMIVDSIDTDLALLELRYHRNKKKAFWRIFALNIGYGCCLTNLRRFNNFYFCISSSNALFLEIISCCPVIAVVWYKWHSETIKQDLVQLQAPIRFILRTYSADLQDSQYHHNQLQKSVEYNESNKRLYVELYNCSS